jgi:hypothetical protein
MFYWSADERNPTNQNGCKEYVSAFAGTISGTMLRSVFENSVTESRIGSHLMSHGLTVAMAIVLVHSHLGDALLG